MAAVSGRILGCCGRIFVWGKDVECLTASTAHEEQAWV